MGNFHGLFAAVNGLGGETTKRQDLGKAVGDDRLIVCDENTYLSDRSSHGGTSALSGAQGFIDDSIPWTALPGDVFPWTSPYTFVGVECALEATQPWYKPL